MIKYSSRRVLAAALLALLSACTHADGSASARDALVIGRVGDFQSLNPLLLSGADSAAIGPLVYSFLVTVDDRGALAPDVALAVPSLANGGISRDGKTIVYRLRRGVRWQDGAPLTSRDVAFTYRQIMNPRNDVQARDVYDRIARLETPDPWTVRLTLHRPNSAMLSYFLAPDGNYPILPEHALRGRSDLNNAPFNAMPVGSGPFRVVEWRRGDRLQLERFDRYFGGTPALRRITIDTLPSAQTLLVEMQTHEIDATFVGSITQLADYANIPGVRAERAPVYGAALLAFNASDPMVSDARVRRALIEAADLPRIVPLAGRGALTTTDAGRGFYGPDYDPSIRDGPHDDVADAGRLLDQAGWTRNAQDVRQRKGVALAPAFAYIQSSPEARAFAVLLQARLQRVGATLILRPYPEQVYGAPASAGGPILGGKFQMVLLQLLASIDPSTEYFLGCSQFPPRGANYTRYCNPAVDRANAAGLLAYDPKERAADSATIQRIVARDLPFVPLWQQANAAAYPSDLEGVRSSAFLIFGDAARWRRSQ